MTIETVKKEEMDSIKAIADMSIQISSAREELIELENTKNTFLEGREREAEEKIRQLLDSSDDLVNKIRKNYEEVHTLHNIVTTYKDSIVEAHAKFNILLADFNERNELWDKKVKNQYLEFAEIEKQINLDKKDISEARKQIKKDQEELRKDKIKIDDEKQIINRAVERLKEGRK